MTSSKYKNLIFLLLTALASLVIVVVVILIAITLIKESYPALVRYGPLKFLFSRQWDYSKEIYGALRPLAGTVLSSFLALAAAWPLSIGAAIFLTELCPRRIKSVVASGLELLAAIPSVIYGLWGLMVMAPFLEKYVQPAIEFVLGDLPIIGSFFQSRSAGGVNLFSASCVLSLMILPFITSLAREAFDKTPPELKESAQALGATKWETVYDVVIPNSRSALAGAVVMALGRALGETMAVAYLIGNRHASLDSIFSPYATITSVMANEFNEAEGIRMSTLFALALVLMLSNSVILIISKRLIAGRRIA
ncbi:MAG: phosphate ABC transporter permease subunit PstC [Deltaproteobacteria bacterium]|jgi:phosphate transport system permease protein|nr:phosphate ABC transporter permease subunit PstC [Deltaproteobacteria bacterium]